MRRWIIPEDSAASSGICGSGGALPPGPGRWIVLALFLTPRGGGIGHDLLMLVVAACAIQGVATVHGLVGLRGRGRGWLVAMYLSLLLVTPAAVLALSVTGFSDAWLDYRTRFDRSQ